MIGALIVAGSYVTVDLIVLIVAARLGVVSLHVRRPPKPRQRPEEAK